MQAKIRKLEKQFTSERPLEIQKQKSSTDIFKGIAIFVNGYTSKYEHQSPNCCHFYVSKRKGHNQGISKIVSTLVHFAVSSTFL